MSGDFKLAAFQQAAVEHIVSRLKDRRGSRRFLLADEVGLGKTIVARGVIDALAKGRRSALKVVYLCSNAEIAAQNRSKLVTGGGLPVGRVTELALTRQPQTPSIELFAFTPGTSLSGGTGMAWERRLMLFLLNHVAGVDVSARRWREYFRCGAGEERWLHDTRWSRLRGEFLYQTNRTFQAELGEMLKSPHEGQKSFVRCLIDDAGGFDAADRLCRGRRNRMLGLLRAMMQRVALRALGADLIVLDEIQRFKEVIDQAHDARAIASELFRLSQPVLILSATPYRLLTLSHELEAGESAHHQDFFRTLDFLFGRDKVTPQRVRKNLLAFGDRLRQTDLTATRDARLVDLKRAIEKDLRLVLSRTERNWFFLDALGGVRERGGENCDLPDREELRDFFDIQHGLAGHLDGSGLVTDFWKSSPSLLTFMDGSYALTQKLRKRRVRVPRRLLAPADDPALPKRNLRFRRVIELSLGAPDALPPLWTRPTYTYHRDERDDHTGPRKVLVFSGWRFVPRAVSVVVSEAAAARVRNTKEETRQPLRITDKWSFHVFDVCFPSLALASLVTPRVAGAGHTPGEARAEDLIEAARDGLRARLAEVGVRIGGSGPTRPWQAIMRLEAASGHGAALRPALRQWTGPEDASTEAVDQHREQLLEWLQTPGPPLQIGEAQLDRLAHVAVASPAIGLLRSLLSVFGPETVGGAMPSIIPLTFGELRSYFNRPLVQQVVRRHLPRVAKRHWRRREGRGFAERVLDYALDHHLQAVFDEHTYLLRYATPATDITKVLDHYQSVWSLGRGSRRTNVGVGSGDRVVLGRDLQVWPTHFALAFGDDDASESSPSEQKDERLRRSEVREAFNSPFWPFVLATTSVGQEGLDFHLYCRDVFHWNLPSNPVDLEQREGRINRRDSLAVRQSIARDWGLPRLSRELADPYCNPWEAVFARLQADPHSVQRYKHGLYPHWLYECHEKGHTVPIERHVAFFEGSRDAERYQRLKRGLALYRLVFGQANQEHLLGDLEERLGDLKEDDRMRAQRRLSGYMLNLSPIGRAEALRYAHTEAVELLSSPSSTGLLRLIADVEAIVTRHRDELVPVLTTIDVLLGHVRAATGPDKRQHHQLRKAVTALAYLRNPYDHFFDAHSIGGFDDDISVLQDSARTLRRHPRNQ